MDLGRMRWIWLVWVSLVVYVHVRAHFAYRSCIHCPVRGYQLVYSDQRFIAGQISRNGGGSSGPIHQLDTREERG